MENISDHNREEAFKAKKITALEKMQNNDFRRARQIILEAQELCPELAENMFQMLIICDIHCAAESIVGGVKDLYGILQVEETADESMITKQYRKIALSTHPDKNSFAGASDAFKLVGEAYSILSDPAKRTLHDKKRKSGSQNGAKEANKNKPSNKTAANEGSVSEAGQTFWTRCPHCECRHRYFINVLNRKTICQECQKIFTLYRIEVKDQQPMPEYDWKRKTGSQNMAKEANKNKPSNKTDANKGGVSEASQTFWTRCPYCECRYQYYINVLNREPTCQECNKRFTAYRIEDQQPMPEHDWKRKNGSQNMPKEANKKKPDAPMPTSSSMSSDSQVSESMFQEQQHDTPSQQGHPVKPSSASIEGQSSAGGTKKSDKSEVMKEKTRISEINKNIVGRSMPDTASSNVFELNKLGRKQLSTMPRSGSYSPGSSGRRKQHVDGKLSQNNSGKNREIENDYSCNTGMNCNQILEGNITSADSQSSQNHMSSNINIQDKTEGMCTRDDDDNIMKDIASVVVEKCYSDPAIQIRDINSITYNDGGVDQIWALYDNIDHMPRTYAKIKCIGHSKCLYRLKFYPLSAEEKERNNKTLPVACGKFCLGEKIDISEYNSFYSHTVEWKKIYVEKVPGKRGPAKTKMMVYEIYPKRGEVWALYKGWSKQWISSSDADKNRSYEYEVVEVLSDMSDNSGANVIPLVRIEDFPSLLVAAKDKCSFHIPSTEVFRFSHRIPHYRICGHENILKKINGPILEKNHNVPEGFLILDSSCLPSDLDATFPTMNLDTYISQSKKRSRNECQYEIVPQVGEIWAIYMDWTPEQNPSSTDCCEFAIGEIIKRNDSCTKFSFLAKVDGCTAVFRPDKKKGVLEIPTGENLRFSHHIPASLRVMKEKGVKRHVFYDLDPAYLVTAQDHATSSGNRSTVDDLAKKQKTAAAHIGSRRTARPTRPNSRYIGAQWK